MANTIGDTLNSLSDPAQDPAVQAENQTILDIHSDIETLGHVTNLNATAHGLTNFGETFGLGKVGGDNLVTDTAQTPGDISNGAAPASEGAGLVTDAGQTTSAGGLFIEGIGTSLSNPDVVQDASSGLTNVAMNDAGNGLGTVNGLSGIDTLGLDGLGVNGNGGEPLVSAGGGAPGNSPILDTGVLASPDNSQPISIAAGNGQNIANVDALSSSNPLDLGGDLGGNGSSGDHLISGDAGSASGSPIAQAGVLNTTDSQSPLGLDVGNGQNIASADLLPNSDVLSGDNLTAPIVGQDLTNGLTGSGNGSGESLVTTGAGAPDSSPIFNGGVLTSPDNSQPLSLNAGNGQNIANVDALSSDNPLNLSGNGAGDHLISGDAGAAGGNPIAQSGVLTTTDSQSPVGVDVGNGQNIASAELVPHSDALQFPDLGGVGTDTLSGLNPSTADLGNILGESMAPPSGDQAFIDANTDGSSSLVQIHDDNSSATLGLNNHAIV
jgi:hypothetical protein